PFYIGDEMEGIEFGPLQQHAEKAIPLPQFVSAGPRAITATAISEEPIAKAAGQTFRDFAHWWNHGAMSTPLKVAVLVAVGILAIFHGGWLVPAAVVLGSVYAVYL